MLKATVKSVSIDQLYFDPNNYRLLNEPRYSKVAEKDITDEIVQKRTLGILCGSKNENIKDLLESFKANGYLPVDQIQVKSLENDNYLVLEGNRRTAALKTLKNDYDVHAIDLGNFDKSIFESIPVVMYEGADNEIQHLIVMGLKHISGNKKWGEWNQAQFIRTLYDSGNYNEDEICSSIGIDKTSLRRSMRALYFIDQYKESDYGDQFTDSMYPVFREIITYPVLRNWLGWDDNDYQAYNDINRERLFALLSKDIEIEDESENQRILIEPAITKREEIRTLAKFIEDEKAMEILESRRSVAEAYNISKAGVKQQLQQPIQHTIDMFESNVSAIKQLQLTDKEIVGVQKQINSLQFFIDKKKSSTATENGTEVFYNHISQHFSKIKIYEYKQLLNLNLQNLKKINIFAGDNNSGKTSLLESIYLLCYQNSFSGLYEIIRRRGKISENRMDMTWFMEQIPLRIDIEGTFDSMPGKININPLREDTSTFDSTGYIKSIVLESIYNNHKQTSTVQVFDDKKYITASDGNKVICPVVFSTPFFLNEPSRYSKFYSKAVQSKSIERIINFIRDFILPKIKDIRLADELQRFRVLDEDFPIAMDLSSYGEGVQRVFFVSLLFAAAEHGVLLLDEFENAIHVELLAHFAEFIEELANEFDVQVFITSHSKECIDAFVYNIKDIDSITYTSLIKNEDGIVTRQFSGKEYKRLVKIADTDLRKAK